MKNFLFSFAALTALLLNISVFPLELAYAETTFSIYEDSLASGWSNWSWNSTVDFGVTDPVYSGSKAIGFYPNPYGALYLHTDNAFDTTSYSYLTFAMNTKYSNQKFQVALYDTNNNVIGSFKSLSNYGGDPLVNQWKTYTIPLSDLGGINRQIKGLAIQSAAGYSELVYIDNLGFVQNQSNQTISPTPSPSSTQTANSSPATSITQNQTALSAANAAYTAWKSGYIQTVSPGVLRVVRPENNNDTVSEGMGYGMLLSMFGNDQTTFDGLWNYTQKYLDSKGLMNWQISSSGSVIGQGSATDADEDIAYALLRADAKWPGHGYGTAASKYIGAVLNTEVLSSNLINPGDNWGATKTMDPSYIDSAYYRAFASFTGNSRWNTIADTTLSWEQNASNANTGLVPDWLNSDYSQASISFDKYPNGFYYDALRAPIRLLMDYKWNNNQTARSILNKEDSFVSSIGTDKLVSGYTLTGSPLTNYIDMAFLSSYAAMGQANSSSQYAADSLNKLIQTSTGGGYFGTSLRTLALYIVGGAN